MLWFMELFISIASLNQPVKDYIRTYDKIRKITTGQRNDYIAACLSDYPYLNKNSQMTSKDLNNNHFMLIHKQ